MPSLLDDSVYKVVQEGIKEDIEIALANNRFRAALILIYAGMDSMAWADLPEHQTDVKSSDFIRWADRYIRFPCAQQVTGEELYGARCGLLHSSGIESAKSRTGKCRMIGYADQGIPEVRFDPRIHPNFVMVSILGLKNAFFAGVNDFLISSFASDVRRPLVEARIDKMVQTFPFRGERAD
jgi:hypothetical protein